MMRAMMLRIFSILALLLLPAKALAQDLEGHWALQIDDATIFVFALERGDDGTWQGAWTRPSQIDSNGAIFRRMSGSQTVRPTTVLQNGEAVQMTFAGPPGTNRNDVLSFSQVSENQARLLYQGIPGEPYPLIRVNADLPLGPFADMRIYDRDNAVIAADFADAPEPLPALPPLEDLGPMDEAALDALEQASSENAPEPEDDVAEEPSRITADFLDGI